MFILRIMVLPACSQTLPTLPTPFVPMFTQVETAEAERVAHLSPAEPGGPDAAFLLNVTNARAGNQTLRAVSNGAGK
jgi:hypothetical protein